MKIMVSTTTVISVPEEKEEEKDDEIVSLPDSSMDCLRWCSAILSILVVRISLLKYSKIHEKPYKFIVCEFGGF